MSISKENSLFICDEEGIWYTCGDHSNGQLGFGYTYNQQFQCFVNSCFEFKITPIDWLPKLYTARNISIVTGRYFTFVKLDSEWHYSGGKLLIERDEGELERPPIFVSFLYKKFDISEISCGFDHFVALTSEGNCYQWIKQQNNEVEEEVLSPKFVQFPFPSFKIKKVKCGYGFTICQNENNELYVWGENDYGQLGLGDSAGKQDIPILLPLPVDKNKETNDKNLNWLSFSCFCFHSLALLTNNTCFHWGHLSDTHFSPTLIDLEKLHLKSNEITAVDCGCDFTVILTGCSSEYVVFGKNSHGELGVGHFLPIKENLPIVMSSPKKEPIECLICGIHWMILITNQNLYVSGDNSKGQIGLGNITNTCTLTELAHPKNKKWVIPPYISKNMQWSRFHLNTMKEILKYTRILMNDGGKGVFGKKSSIFVPMEIKGIIILQMLDKKNLLNIKQVNIIMRFASKKQNLCYKDFGPRREKLLQKIKFYVHHK